MPGIWRRIGPHPPQQTASPPPSPSFVNFVVISSSRSGFDLELPFHLAHRFEVTPRPVLQQWIVVHINGQRAPKRYRLKRADDGGQIQFALADRQMEGIRPPVAIREMKVPDPAVQFVNGFNVGRRLPNTLVAAG